MSPYMRFASNLTHHLPINTFNTFFADTLGFLKVLGRKFVHPQDSVIVPEIFSHASVLVTRN